MIILRGASCNGQSDMVIRTAAGRTETLMMNAIFIVMPAADLTMIVAAHFLVTDMTGMYVGTCQTADKSRDKTAAAGFAGMHIEAYDTETVPQYKQHSAESDISILHINLQIYKNHRKGQTGGSIKKREITEMTSLCP